MTIHEEELRALIAETVADAVTDAVEQSLDKFTSPCACDITPEARTEMGHLMGMVRDLGRGDTARGVESMRESLKFVPALMHLRNRIGTWVLSAAIAALTGGLLALVWQGLTLRLGGGK